MAGPNARLSRRMLETMGVWEEALATGAVFVNPYDPANVSDMRRNLADSLSLGFSYTSPLADLLEAAFAKRTAAEWERLLAANGSCATIIMTWEEWQRDADARAAGVFVELPGTDTLQIGRAVWMRSALPYSPLAARRTTPAFTGSAADPPAGSDRAKARLPLEGYKVVDMTNVLAGPSCTRMLGELGADVIRVDVMDPQPPPTIHVLWSGENSVGKRSIIVDRRKTEGLAIIHQITGGTDILVANMMDDQMARLGTDAASLAQRNPPRSACRSPRHARAARPTTSRQGWDPSIQGTTGIMMRFGGPELADLPRHRLRGGLFVRLSCRLFRPAGAVRAGTARRRRGRLGGDVAVQRGDADPVAVPASGH